MAHRYRHVTLRALGALLATATLAGPTSPAQAQGTGVDARAAQAWLGGRWQGNGTCGGRTDLTLQFDKAEVQGPVVVLHGTAKSAPKIDAQVTGRYDPANGLLMIDGNVVPDDPNYCPGTRVLGKCMELTVGKFITPEKTREEHRKERAALTLASTFAIDVARGDDGATLAGTVRGAGFDCAAFQLSRADHAAPTMLAPRTVATERAALARIDGATSVGVTSAQARGAWLEALAQRGDPIAMADLGRQYEAGTGGHPPDIAKAVAWYLKAAGAGEARAQRRLADLYAKGQGVPMDAAQSARWNRAASETAADVGRYCVAPAMLEGYAELIDSLKKDPTNVLVGAAATMMMGISVNEGTIAIEGAGIEEVTLRDGPFQCRIVGRRVGASVRNVTPAFTYAGVDQDGYSLYYDHSAQAASNEAIASIANTLMSKSQATQAFQVTPVGGNRFHVTIEQQVMTTGHVHATDVIIDPATLVSADRAATAPPTSAPVTPPSPVPALTMAAVPARAERAADAPGPQAAIDPQRERSVWSLCQSAKGPAMCQAYLSEFPNGPHSGQARGILSDMSADAPAAAAPTPVRAAALAAIDASGKDDAAIMAAINTGFVKWSREWQYDHYLGNSAKLQQRRCGGSACQLTGGVMFQRMGQTLPLAFTANVARQPDGQIGIVRLCYSDNSSGMSDCKDF